MYITRLTLDEFRQYEHMKIDVSQAGLRIVGKNASGKSSLLEALLILATTKSPRALVEKEMIRWESGERFGVPPYARIFTHVVTNYDAHDLEIRLEAATTGTTSKKTCLVDDRSVRASTMVGVLKVVEFSPEDVQLVTGSPADRRRQLDILISQIDRHYMQASTRYAKVLAQRNGLLRAFSKDGVTPASRQAQEQLAFWDEELVQHGSLIVAGRIRIVQALAALMSTWSQELLQDHHVELTYQPGVSTIDDLLASSDESLDLGKQISSRFSRALAATRAEDFRRGTTTIGPQRDDVHFRLNGRSMAAFGSRGQQRLGVIALKLSEAEIIEQMTGETPVLLLDDALSELDEFHAAWLLNCLATSQRQLLLTSAIPSTLQHPELEHLEMIELEVV